MGGSLPRRDQGDHEYYCCTMLTMFKPWRSGKDLKNKTEDWKETFSTYNFSKQQYKLMDNFNLRYECNDARDDFSAAMKKKGLDAKYFSANRGSWIDEHSSNDMNGNTFGMEEDTTEEEVLNIGRAYQRLLDKMKETARFMLAAGWLDKSSNGLPIIDISLFCPESYLPGSKWKTVIQDQRKALLADRAKTIPIHRQLDPTGELSKNATTNSVSIVDADYFKYDFKAVSDEAQKHIDNTCVQFGLNTEQERAFKIIANHASSPSPEQLKMYLGGMGGTGKSQVIKALIRLFEARNETH